jgi:hypothetical protein
MQSNFNKFLIWIIQIYKMKKQIAIVKKYDFSCYKQIQTNIILLIIYKCSNFNFLFKISILNKNKKFMYFYLHTKDFIIILIYLFILFIL